MHFYHLLATSVAAVSAKPYYGHYAVSLGSSKISGIQAWHDVSVQARQAICSDKQNFTVTATDADGDDIGSTTGVDSVELTLPEDSTYPVTVEASSAAGTINTVLTNDKLPIDDSDDASTRTFQYVLEFDFCPENLELKRVDGCSDKEFDDGWCIPKEKRVDGCSDKEFDDGWCIP